MSPKALLLALFLAVSTGAGAQVLLADSATVDSLFLSMFLDDVPVVTHRPVVKFSTDKANYRVADDPDSKTLSVLEMLRKVPMVSVDGKGNISVNGSKEFKVYVDGRLSTMISRNPSKVLRSMPANAVMRIEVITSPGSRYDAEGVGGILHLITKSNKAVRPTDFSATLHSSVGSSRWGQDVAISHSGGRWTTDANLMGEYEYQAHAPMSSTVTHLGDKPSFESSAQDSWQRMPSLMGQAEVGCRLDSLSDVHLSLAGNRMRMREAGPTSYFVSHAEAPLGVSLLSDNNSRFDMAGLDINCDYVHHWGAEKEGSLMVAYQFAHASSDNSVSQAFADEALASSQGFASESMDNCERGLSHHLLADASLPVASMLKINTGSKFSENISKSDVFRQRQSVLALYAEAALESERFSTRAGLRHEYTWQKSHYRDNSLPDFSMRYAIWAPSASLTLSFDENASLGANYNMRVRRPDIEELDPFVNRTDPFAISFGNPLLSVEKKHQLSLVYMLHLSRLSLNATLAHSFSNNGILQYSFKEDGLVNNTFGNVGNYRSTALNVYACLSLSGSTRLLVNAEVAYVYLLCDALSARNDGWRFNCNTSFQQTLPWQLKMVANVEYMSKDYTLQGWESGMALASASLSRAFLSDRLHVALSADSGLGHGGCLVWRSYAKTPDFVSDYSFDMPAQNISLGITYSLGLKPKAKDPDDGLALPQKRSRKH